MGYANCCQIKGFNPHRIPRDDATAAEYRSLPPGLIVPDARTSFQCIIFPTYFSDGYLLSIYPLALKPLDKGISLDELILREPRAQPVSTPGSRFSSIGMINRMAIGQVIFNTWKTI